MEPAAIDYGIPATDYWMMTFGEIMSQVESNKRKRETELKEKAMFDYKAAQLNMYAFNDPSKMPTAEKHYPYLVDEKVRKVVQPAPDPDNWQSDKALMMQQAMQIKATKERRKRMGGE